MLYHGAFVTRPGLCLPPTMCLRFVLVVCVGRWAAGVGRQQGLRVLALVADEHRPITSHLDALPRWWPGGGGGGGGGAATAMPVCRGGGAHEHLTSAAPHSVCFATQRGRGRGGGVS
jgi:hypothetical protein